MPSLDGRWVWHELMTTDPTAAIRFYTDVVGWGTQRAEGPLDYTMLTADGTPVAGVVELPEPARAAGAPPHWMGYIGTANVDESVARATQLGGQVYVEPTDVPNIGRFAVLADPQGATFALFTGAQEPPVEPGPPGIREFSWNELATTDYAAAFDFYSMLAGWTVVNDMDMGDDGLYRIYGQNGASYGGIFRKPAQMPGPPAWLHYARVPDLDAALDRVRAGGGQILVGPMEVPGGSRIAQCTDPQGAVFALHEQAETG